MTQGSAVANEQHALWGLCSRELLWEGFCSTAIPPVCGIRLPGAEAPKGCSNALAEVTRAIQHVVPWHCAPILEAGCCLPLSGGISVWSQGLHSHGMAVRLSSQPAAVVQPDSTQLAHLLSFSCLLLSDLLCQASER